MDKKKLAALLTLAAFGYTVYKAWPKIAKALKDLNE